jgi:hypothetical protein
MKSRRTRRSGACAAVAAVGDILSGPGTGPLGGTVCIGAQPDTTQCGHPRDKLGEATGSDAKTIHRLLEVDPRGGGFKRGDDNPLNCDLLVVDEASMVDVMLMQALLKAVPHKAALLHRSAVRSGLRPWPRSVHRRCRREPGPLRSFQCRASWRSHQRS